MSVRALRWAGLLVGLLALGFVLVSATLIDRRPPTVSSIAVSRTAGDPAVALTHAAIDVAFSEPVVRASAERRFRITPSVEGAFTWADERTLVFTPARQLPTATEFTVAVEPGFLDLAGNAATDPASTLSFRTVGLPTVVSTQPVAGADAVPLDTAITLEFDRLMDTERTAAAIRLEPAASLRTAWNGTTLIATAEGGLAPNTDYTLRVEPTAADTDGNALAAPFEVRFTTIATGLGVAETMPRDGSAGAPLAGPIAIRFDAPIDPDSLAGSLTLTPTVTGEVRAVAAPSEAGDSDADPTLLVFEPVSLAAHTTYTVQLAPGVVRSADGRDTAEGRTWRFTTGGPATVLQNQILFLSQRGGVRNVWAMNPDGTNAHAVTAELAPVISYDASADGRTLVYEVAGTVRRLTLPEGTTSDVTADGATEYAPRLTPDASAVAVWRRARDTGADEGLWLVPLTGDGAPRQLLAEGAPEDGAAAAAPAVPGGDASDASWLAPVTFAADGASAIVVPASGEASVIDVATRAATPAGIADVFGPAVWLPNPSRFALTGRRDDETRTWFVADDGTVTAGPALVGWIGAASNGALVGRAADGSGGLVHVTRGGTRTAITAAEGFEDRQPRFGPGGESVVFVRVDRDSPDRSAGIWTVRSDGLEARQLSADGTDPRWLP